MPSDRKSIVTPMDRLGTRLLIIGAALAFCATGAFAAGTAIPHGTVELIAENQWIAAGHTVHLGLRFELEKGWHIYWINPGDSGEPPRVKWQLPSGLTAEPIEWPAPRRLGTSSVTDYGYEDAVTLIVPVRADANLAAQQPAQLGAQLNVLVCREMCIPGKAQVSLTLPVKALPPATDTRTESLFAATRKSLPQPAPGNWKFSIVEANGGFTLTANVGRQITQAVFYPLMESQIDNASPQKLVALASGFRLTLRESDQLLKPIERLQGVLVLSGHHAYRIDVPVSKVSAETSRYDIGTHPANRLEEGL
jgi:DsbC/DsbD-like thiol-disulfide interchange protein